MVNIKTKIISCSACGKDFEANIYTNYRTKYCPECRSVIERNRNCEKSKRQAERRRKRKQMEKETISKPTLSDVERMARESGMTYGKFCAKMKI